MKISRELDVKGSCHCKRSFLLLKMGVFLLGLSERFDMPVVLISKTFTIWINFSNHELPLYFPFPSQKLVRWYLPQRFEKYPTTQIIIDGTDIFVERASSLKTQAQTWCNYKHHNTWKALAGISLNDVVTFVSSIWNGPVWDKELTKCLGLLEKLKLGDNIMVDRGLDIANILPSGVTSFKGGRGQLNPEKNWWDS